MFLWPPLPVVLPLFTAAFVAAAGPYLPRKLVDAITLGTAAAVMAVCCLLTLQSSGSAIVYWFGAWVPYGHFPIGVAFVIDPMGAGMAAFVAFLVMAAFTFSWQYFDDVRTLYHSLMLIFLAAMCGMCLTGDIFNMFVWFELMSAAGVALCGYHADETGPLQGAINFSVMNTLGAFLSLSGVAMLYSRTGALNFAGIEVALQRQEHLGVFLPIVFIFVIAGFLVKSAAFPFHFWLDDAHAVAPTPVCILFSGVMVELGLFAAARVYYSVFAIALLPWLPALRTLFLAVGATSAIVGGLMAFGQRHLKRLLAFSTISHMGVMILGFALFTSTGLAGTALYVLGHGLVKGALFVGAGILLNRFQSVDEFALQNVGRQMPKTAIIFILGAVGLAGMPPFATYFGEAAIEHSGTQAGLPWISIVIMLSGFLTAGAVLRVAGRVFFGWGEKPTGESRAPRIDLKREMQGQKSKTPPTMWLPAAVMLIIAIALGWFTPLRQAILRDATWFRNTRGYVAAVLHGSAGGPGQYHVPVPHAMPGMHIGGVWMPDMWREVITLALAALLAAIALFPYAIGRRAGTALRHGAALAMRPLHAIHSGKIGDYVAWFTVGIAALAGYLALRR